MEALNDMPSQVLQVLSELLHNDVILNTYITD